MELIDYVIQEAYIVVLALWFIGAILKNTPKVEDWSIPYILLLPGIVLTIALLGLSAENFIQGILVTGAAVLGHQLVKQAKEKLK
jgi:hypothetical protein